MYIQSKLKTRYIRLVQKLLVLSFTKYYNDLLLKRNFMNSLALLLALAIEPNQQITLEQFNSLPKHLNEGQVHHFKLLKNINDSNTKHTSVNILYPGSTMVRPHSFFYVKKNNSWHISGYM